ncbi:MAG: hypothetical protein V3V33_10255 [Candidatus Lokiarchaeia archaeon]
MGLGVLYYDYIHDGGTKTIEPSTVDIDYFETLSKELYLNKHHLYFTNYDAVRLVEFRKEKLTGIKYTENWAPILKRMIMMGNLPEDAEPDIKSENSQDLFNEALFRRILLEELHKKNTKYSHVTETLEILQAYHFHFPWYEYLQIGRKEDEIELFLKIAKIILTNKSFNKEDFNKLNKFEKDFIIKRHWVANEYDILEIPFIIQLDNKFLIPRYFLAREYQMYDLFSSKNKKKLGDYKRDLGIILENRIFDELHNYNLDFYSPTTSKKELLRYPNPFKAGQELLDVGALDHQTKRFYVIECKNKMQINLRTYDLNVLNDSIIKEFNKFKDRDLPDVELLKKDWGINDYEIVPMYYNLVPLFGEFKKFQKFVLLDNIYIIQNRSEIGAIINTNFHSNDLSFDDVYNIPGKLDEIINGKLKISVNPKKDQDVGYLFGETPEKYQILTSKFEKIDENPYISEIWIKRDKVPYGLFIDIPTNLLPQVKALRLKKGDLISTLIYRRSPFSPVIILGKIWKIS